MPEEIPARPAIRDSVAGNTKPQPITPEEHARRKAQREADDRQRQAEAAEAAAELGEPSLLEKGSHYIAALLRWRKAGYPRRSQAEAEALEAICRANKCRAFDEEAAACKICGCKISASRWAIASKTRMATEKCPKGLWK